MPTVDLIDSSLRNGIWQGVLCASGSSAPQVEISLDGETLAQQSAEPGNKSGEWIAKVALPASVLSDGIQTLLISHSTTGETLGQIVLRAGAPCEIDIYADVAVLRAELNMLKSAFRRHCKQTESVPE